MRTAALPPRAAPRRDDRAQLFQRADRSAPAARARLRSQLPEPGELPADHGLALARGLPLLLEAVRLAAVRAHFDVQFVRNREPVLLHHPVQLLLPRLERVPQRRDVLAELAKRRAARGLMFCSRSSVIESALLIAQLRPWIVCLMRAVLERICRASASSFNVSGEGN
jgi:hypothetical protein